MSGPNYNYPPAQSAPAGPPYYYPPAKGAPNGGWAPPPMPPAQPKGHRGAAIAVVVAVIVVALALVTWFVVMPMLQGGGQPSPSGPASPTGAAPTNSPASSNPTPTDATTQPGGGRLPDIMTMPAGWSQPIDVGESYIWNYNTVTDTGAGSIVILGLSDGIVAVDLDEPLVLWAIEGASYAGTLASGLGVVVTAGDVATVSTVDLHSGQLTKIGILNAGESVAFIVDNRIVVDELFDSQYMVHSADNFSGGVLCTVDYQPVEEIYTHPVVFGDGRYVNAASGVFDVVSCQAASFGADAGNDVYYAGPRDAVVRVSFDGSAYSVQPWDTSNDRALAAPVAMEGSSLAWGVIDWRELNWPWLLTEDSNDSLSIVLRAYSWQTGQKLWVTSLTLGKWAPDCAQPVDVGGVIMVSMGDQSGEAPDDPSIDCTNPQAAVVDAGTGRVLLQRDLDFYAVGSGARVAYIQDYSQNALTGYDLGSGGFNLLWTIKDPAATVKYLVAANRVFAWSQAGGDLWVLET